MEWLSDNFDIHCPLWARNSKKGANLAKGENAEQMFSTHFNYVEYCQKIHQGEGKCELINLLKLWF